MDTRNNVPIYFFLVAEGKQESSMLLHHPAGDGWEISETTAWKASHLYLLSRNTFTVNDVRRGMAHMLFCLHVSVCTFMKRTLHTGRSARIPF